MFDIDQTKIFYCLQKSERFLIFFYFFIHFLVIQICLLLRRNEGYSINKDYRVVMT